MRQMLKLHPESRCAAVTAIAVEATRPRAGLLVLRYVLTGSVSDLKLPAPTAPTRADELWRHTCFEAFVGAADRDAYLEFNLAPSSQWAAYQFTGYRQGMAPLEEFDAPGVEMTSTGQGLELRGALNLERVAELATNAPWRLGLSAVIEAADGAVSYWALAHPPGRADFHHPDCFVAELPATERP
jgi:hypothetical protein